MTSPSMTGPSFEELVAAGLARYRDLCAAEGVDPEVELAEARLAAGVAPVLWASCRLLGGDRETITLETVVRASISGSVRERVEPEVVALIAAGDLEDHNTMYWPRRPSCPPVVLDRFAQHPNSDVRQQVVYNANTLPGTLDRLADDTQPGVRQVAIRHPNTTLDTLVRVYATDWRARVAIARRDPPHPAFVDRLATDEHQSVRRALAMTAASHPIAVRLAHDPDPEVREALAGTPSVSAEALAVLARDTEMAVRLRVARHRGSAVAPVLPALAGDTHARVRASVAANKHTPASVLEQLAADPMKSVSAPAVKHLARLARRARRAV